MTARRTVVVFLVALVVAVPAALGRPDGARVRSLDAQVLVRLNAIRPAHGLVPLRPNATLAAAAAGHSEQMLADGYFAHESADGTPFSRRLTGYSAGTRAWSAGENLLWSSPAVTASRALALWMASPGHRANILNARWREIGIASIHADFAPGTYGNRPVTVITTDFGFRR